MTENEIIEAFRSAMHAAGIRYSGPIDADGELHRVHLDGDRKGRKNGWFVLHLDGKKPAGAFGSHKGDFRHTWKADQPAKQLTAAELKKIQDAARQREKDRRQRERDKADLANRIFVAGGPAPIDHPYLVLKGIAPHGARLTYHDLAGDFKFDKWLVLPLRDADGVIRTLEYISATGEKRFLPGGRKAGCFYAIGEIDGAEKILIVEGFATGASVREAAALPVIVAADCGNLLPVAEAIRKKYPETKFVFAADNDAETDGNPGLTKATEAARAVGGLVAVPAFKDKPGARCDFNDLHLAEGLDRVRELIEAAAPPAIESPTPPPAADRRRAEVESGRTVVANKKFDHELIEWAKERGLVVSIDRNTKSKWRNPFKIGEHGNRDEVCEKFEAHFATKPDLAAAVGELRGKVLACHCHPERCHGDFLARLANESESGEPSAKADPAPPPPAAPAEKPAEKKGPLAKFLDARPDGLFLVTINKDGQETAWKISSPLKLISRGRDQHGEQWGVWIELVNPDGQVRTEFVPWASLHGDAADVMRTLAGLGVIIRPHAEARRRLIEYLLSETDDRARVVTSTGWHITDEGAAFVLPNATIGDAGERLFLIGGSAHAAAFSTGGTLAGWQQHVARLAVGNSRLMFVICAAFAPPLLHLLGIENGGINLIGNSAIGKTRLVTAAAGVWGKPSALKKTWRSTDNALEGTAAASNDALLVLDELGQCDPRIVGETVYMLGQGAAKARSKTDGTLRRRVEWRTLFLSSAEVSLAAHMGEVGRRPRAGQEMRILDVPADAGAERGVFEQLHDHANSGELSDALDHAVHQHYGHAARAFLAWLIQHRAEVPGAWRDLRKEFEFEAVPAAAHGQVRRAADRFALVALAGMLAARAGVVPWTEGPPLDAAARMFRDWIGARGGSGNAELIRALQQVRAWFAAHAEARLADWDRTAADDDHAPRVIQRAGFRRHDKATGKTMFYVFPSVFADEICKGYSPGEIARELMRLKHLLAQKDKGREVPYSKQRLPGYANPARVYVFEDSIFDAGHDAGDQDLDNAAA